jgi:capsular exopolysaccharide synthesis family protein
LQASRQALITQSAALIANGLAQGTNATLSAPPAASATPIKPRRSLNLLAGLVLGLLLGVAITWMRHILQPGLRSAEEAVAVLGDVPVLASIPLISGPRSEDPMLPEAYSILHTNLVFAMRDQDLGMVTFVGPDPQVGKTSTVEELANLAARWGGQRVLVLDGDMRAGTLSTRMGQSHHVGLGDLLGGDAELDEALVSLGPRLSLLPSRPSGANPPDLLAGSRMRTLVAELRMQFDIILVDSPPIAGLADALVLASLSDAVVMVVRAHRTTPSALTAAARSLRQAHARIAGVVVFEDRPVEAYYPVSREDTEVRDGADVTEAAVTPKAPVAPKATVTRGTTGGRRKDRARKGHRPRKGAVASKDPVQERSPTRSESSPRSKDPTSQLVDERPPTRTTEKSPPSADPQPNGQSRPSEGPESKQGSGANGSDSSTHDPALSG